MLEMLYYTVAAVILYAFADWMLNRIEALRGARFPNRSLVFFLIILTLAIITFQVIQKVLGI